jgi:hypothetical protein
MEHFSIPRIFLGIFIGLFLLVSFGATVVFYGVKESEVRAAEMSSASLGFKPVQLAGQPSPSQSDINQALEAFDIRIPKNVKGPFFSSKLEDRGLTIRKGVMSDAVVYVGNDAFSSWALLGSTLAHEIEVHCRQNFLAIHFQNISGFDGTGYAEREAYGYELAHAGRFGLTVYERDLISSTMMYFYPKRQNQFVQKLDPIRFWLDRLAASSFGKVLL